MEDLELNTKIYFINESPEHSALKKSAWSLKCLEFKALEQLLPTNH